jgi:hypothetical protein
MTTISSEPVKVTIPAACLEDVRTAIVTEIQDDGEMLGSNHKEVLDGLPAGSEDRSAAVRHLSEDMQLLGQVLDAEGETTMTGDRDAVGMVLERLVRVLVPRLVDEASYGPMEMRAVLDITGRMQWAAREAIRVAPSEFDHPKEA